LLRCQVPFECDYFFLSSDDVRRRHQEALQVLRVGAYARTLDARISYYAVIAVAIVGAGILLGGALKFAVLCGAFLIILVGLKTSVRRHRTDTLPIDVKVTTSASQFVHAKLYIVDKRVAFVGSANLTYSGMNRDGERVEVKTEPSEVQQEMQAFEHFWGPKPLRPAVSRHVRWRNKAIFREIDH
jgi:hypothetical protein